MPDRSNTNFADVHLFHTHFGLPAPQLPQELLADVLEFRRKFMQEELDEFMESWNNHDLAGQADALIDLVYVAMGTAVMMGLPWQLLWDEVQRKNMMKVKVESAADSKRGHAFDIKKPEGWTPPDIEALLRQYVDSQRKPFDVIAAVNEARDKGVEDPYGYVSGQLEGITRAQIKAEYHKQVYAGTHRGSFIPDEHDIDTLGDPEE